MINRAVIACGLVVGLVAPAAAQQRTDLRSGWAIQSSCQVAEKGGQIATPAFAPKGWHSTTVPATVLAALVADKVFPDPFAGMNLRSIPGTSYPIGVGGQQRQAVRVRLKNIGRSLAFMVRLRLVDERTHDDILPILWDDNFFPLMPGEEREMAGSYLMSDAPGAVRPVVRIEGATVVAKRGTAVPMG
jgi:hypothetical protein